MIRRNFGETDYDRKHGWEEFAWISITCMTKRLRENILGPQHIFEIQFLVESTQPEEKLRVCQYFSYYRVKEKKKTRKEKEFNGSEHVCNAIILSLWYNEKDSLNLYKECSKCMLESITFVRRNERKREINFERIINILSIFTCKYRIIVEIPWYFI